MDKVLSGKIYILISLDVKAFTQVNSQQMYINFNTFSSFSRVNCVTRINFNLDAVHKVWKLLQCKGSQFE